MARYKIPPNTGKVRVVMGLGNTYAVWNGKTGPNEFVITFRKRKTAAEVCEKINKKKHNGEIEVLE